MKYSELKALNADQRKKKLIEVKKELLKLNAQVATGTAPKSPGEIKNLRRTIARLNALQNG